MRCTFLSILVMCLLTLLYLPALGQETKTVVRKQGRPKQVVERYSVLRSDKTTRHGPYIAYFHLTEAQRRAVRKGQDSLARYVRQRGAYFQGKKHGDWAEFSRPGMLLTKGRYELGKKTGIWLTAKEGGEVLERYDHSTGQKLTPEINFHIPYPPAAREVGIQGEVAVRYRVHADCSLTEVEVMQSSHVVLSQATLRAVEKFHRYQKQYGPLQGCEPKSDIFKVTFRLDE